MSSSDICLSKQIFRTFSIKQPKQENRIIIVLLTSYCVSYCLRKSQKCLTKPKTDGFFMTIYVSVMRVG